MVKVANRSYLFSQNLKKLWNLLAKSTDAEDKELIGKAFVTELLGLSENDADSFAGEHGPDKAHSTRMKVTNILFETLKATTDTSGYWKKVSEILPNKHSPEELEFLITEGGIGYIISFTTIMESLGQASPTLIAVGTCFVK